MVRVFLTALFALQPSAWPAPPEASPDLDGRCYRLMAELAASEDPQVRAAGMVGAQYFLGRLDAAAPADGPAGPPRAGDDSPLLTRCAGLMGAGGRDFRALGARLARRPDAV